MFLVNSRLDLFTAAFQGKKPWGGTLSSEVTGLICLVPWPRITRTPEDTLLDYQCRFAVRIANNVAIRSFSWKHV